MKILANIGQEKYFQFSGVNGVFAELWVEKEIFWTTPIHLATRNQGKTIEKGFQACRTTFWRWLPHNSDLMNPHALWAQRRMKVVEWSNG